MMTAMFAPGAQSACRVRLLALLFALGLVGACGDAETPGVDDPARPAAELSDPGAGDADTQAWKKALFVAAQELGASEDLEQAELAPLGETPRMQRILRADVPPSFEATGPAPTPLEPRQVPLGPGFAAKQRKNAFLLEPGAQLISETKLGIPSDEIAELLLRVRVASGTAIEVFFHLRRATDASRVSIPISPSGEWQTLRISQPLLMRANFADHVDRISLASPKDVGETLLLQIEPLLIARPGAVYALSTHGWRDEVVGESLRPSLWQSTAGTLRMSWPADTGRSLRGAVALRQLGEAPAGAPAPEMRVFSEDARGVRTLLLNHVLRAEDAWSELEIELPEGLESAELVLETRGLHPGDVALHADWRALDTTRPPRRAVLLVMDTLRADALGAYGAPDDPSPALDALAREGVLFTRCYSQAPWTRPSMPSIMTGLYTPETGVENKFDQLPESYDTLAERFAAAGWRTAAFVANAQAGPAAGLGQGWDELVLCFGQDSDEQFKTIVEPRVAQLGDEDLLLYVHLMEAHGPYGPEKKPEGFEELPGTPVEFDMLYERRWTKSPTFESRRYWYDHDLRSMDAAIGGFLERVVGGWERQGGAVPVAALSDHGEWLGEEGLWGHGKGLMRPEIVHTPLILRAPGQLPAGRVFSDPVENLDVGATLLELVGAPLRDTGADHGRSLLPRLDGDGLSFALSSNVSGKVTQFTLWSPRGALYLENHELKQRQDGSEPPRAATEADLETGLGLAVLHDLFVKSGGPLKEHHWSSVVTNAQQLDAESLEQLRALGYLGY